MLVEPMDHVLDIIGSGWECVLWRQSIRRTDNNSSRAKSYLLSEDGIQFWQPAKKPSPMDINMERP
jgi:hypothetical protein